MNTSSAEFLATKANKDTTHTNIETAPPEMIGAEMLVRALHKEGVEFVWGYPGGSVLFKPFLKPKFICVKILNRLRTCV